MLDEPTRLVEPEDVMPAQSPSGPRSNPRARPDRRAISRQTETARKRNLLIRLIRLANPTGELTTTLAIPGVPFGTHPAPGSTVLSNDRLQLKNRPWCG